MKWEPAALMVLVFLLGAWVAYDPGPSDLRPGAEVIKFTIGSSKGYLEMVRPMASPADAASAPTFRILYRNGAKMPPDGVLTQDQLTAIFGREQVAEMTRHAGNWLFRKLNVTSWAGVAWVVAGFGGQLAFSGRWLVQWLVSEKQKSSVVPVSFWWLSLIGGVILFAYFAWRADIVGVLGQTSGVVIYARNIRLRAKQLRREAAAGLAAAQLEPKSPIEASAAR